MLQLQLAVPMHCQSCADDIKSALDPLGLEKLDIDVEKDTVVAYGDVPPSAVISAITNTGRDAIIRGTGEPDSAAVCILEDSDGKPHGLVRIVRTKDTLFDLSISASIFDRLGPKLLLSAQQFGDISQGALSTGKITDKLLTIQSPSISAYARQPISIKSLIGRSLVLGPSSGVTADSLVGIVARSAGMWELDKTVCSCTGNTMWQETRVN